MPLPSSAMLFGLTEIPNIPSSLPSLIVIVRGSLKSTSKQATSRMSSPKLGEDDSEMSMVSTEAGREGGVLALMRICSKTLSLSGGTPLSSTVSLYVNCSTVFLSPRSI